MFWMRNEEIDFPIRTLIWWPAFLLCELIQFLDVNECTLGIFAVQLFLYNFTSALFNFSSAHLTSDKEKKKDLSVKKSYMI